MGDERKVIQVATFLSAYPESIIRKGIERWEKQDLEYRGEDIPEKCHLGCGGYIRIQSICLSMSSKYSGIEYCDNDNCEHIKYIERTNV